MREAAKKVEEAFREAHTFKPKKMRSTSEKLAATNRRKKENDDSMKCVKTTTRVNDEDKDGSENIKSFSKITISANSEKLCAKTFKTVKLAKASGATIRITREFARNGRIGTRCTSKCLKMSARFPDIHSSSEKHYYETKGINSDAWR